MSFFARVKVYLSIRSNREFVLKPWARRPLGKGRIADCVRFLAPKNYSTCVSKDLTRCISSARQSPWWRLDFRIYNSNLALPGFVSTCEGERRSHNSVAGLTWENRYDVSFLTPIITLHDQLMCSCDKSQSIIMIECLRNILSKGVTRASRTDTPSTSIIRITP